MKHFVTGAERLRREGHAEGKAEGKAEVKAEGKAEGILAALLRLTERRFGTVPADLLAHIKTGTMEQLDRWLDRVLDVDRVEDLLRE